MGLADDFAQAQVGHHGDEDEESTQARAEGARLVIEGADIGDGGGFGPDGGGTFVVASLRQTSEAFLAQQDGQGVNADGVASGGQFALNVVDGQVLFAKSDDEFTGPIAQGSVVGPSAKDLKESLAKVAVVA